MTRASRIVAPTLAATILLLGGVAEAQPAPAPSDAAPAPAPAPPPSSAPGAATAIQGVTPQYVDKPSFDGKGRLEGLSARLSTGGTMSFANNNNVVGQTDGSSISIGMKVDGGLDLNHGDHEWRNTLGVLAAITRTPVLPDFVKTADNLAFDSIYLYHVVSWFGPFARASAQTAMFRGTDYRANPSHYVITKLDGSIERITADHMVLSDPFRPATLKQSAGVFVQPYASSPVTVELRGGVGGQEVLADQQLAITPPAAPKPGMLVDPFEVDLTELQTVNQVGAELALAVWGGFATKKLTYKLEADAMTPFAHTALKAGDTRGAFALTNVQVDGAVSLHLVDWASLDYQLKVLRQPQVIDQVQVQNTLLVTFGISYGHKPAPPATPPAAPPPAAPTTVPPAAPAK